MVVKRNSETGRYESDNGDAMTRMMVERRQNSRGMRILRQLAAIDAREQAAKKQQGEQ